MTPARGADLTGQIFGALTVVRRIERPGPHAVYLCDCACGIQTDARADNLRTGRTTSCGCRRTAALVEARLARPDVRPPRVIPPPPGSAPRLAPRMLPIYASTTAHRSERTTTHDERDVQSAQARAWGVTRRHDCSSYDACLSRVPGAASDARCPRVCPGYQPIARRIEDHAGWRTTD